MSAIAERLQAVQTRIAEAEQASGRVPGSVRLLAVSKAQPAEHLRIAHAAGQRCFGENYVQEGVEKQAALQAVPIQFYRANRTRR